MTKSEGAQAAKAAKRIRDLADSLGLNQTEFARYIGLPKGQPQVRRWMLGESIPTARNAALIAAKGNGNPSYYQGLDIAPQDAPAPGAVLVPHGGELQAGVWRESVDHSLDDMQVMPLPRQIAGSWRDLSWFVVRGESMNLKYPDGSVVIAASVFTNPLEPTSGTDVIVQRKSTDGTYESTIKEFVRDANGKTWLVPRSTEPEFQLPIDLANGNHEDEDVVITGVVLYQFKALFAQGNAPAPRATSKLNDILERHQRGEPHTKIAADYGMTRERVRQIVATMGGETRSAQKKRRADRIERVIKGERNDE